MYQTGGILARFLVLFYRSHHYIRLLFIRVIIMDHAVLQNK